MDTRGLLVVFKSSQPPLVLCLDKGCRILQIAKNPLSELICDGSLSRPTRRAPLKGLISQLPPPSSVLQLQLSLLSYIFIVLFMDTPHLVAHEKRRRCTIAGITVLLGGETKGFRELPIRPCCHTCLSQRPTFKAYYVDVH